jgi:D-alanyl-D-alanine carboxypeptidase/D-alanyl-D-alanine-endopeptidase (penicillin-binding protein 4)
VSRLGTLVLALALSAGCAAKAAPVAPGTTAQGSARTAAAVRDLRTQLATVFNAPVTAHATWGVEVRSLDRGDVLFALNAGRLMMPASNMKILTLAAAAEALGWDHRFTTTLETTAPVEAGVLRGDLIVRGSGDPTISTRGNRGEAVFDQWAAALRAAGISSIDGRILGDDGAFDDEGVGPGWSWDYLEAGYAAPVGALQYNENTADLTTAPGTAVGDPILFQLAPGTGFTVTNRAVTTAGAESRVRGSVGVRRRIDRPEIELSGMLPVDAPAATRVVAVLNPTQFFAESLKHALVARGIAVSGAAADMDDLVPMLPGTGPERRVLAAATSPTLREIGTVLMKVSQNQYAETLLKALGASDGGIGTTAGGRRRLQDIFTSWGIPPDGYVVSDGSGLSRYNYVSPATVNALLARLHGDVRHRDAFIATLPIAGKDGTIASRMRRSRAEGNAVAKTGSIANTRALSGYVRSRSGETLAFSIIANDFVAPAATITWMADLAVEILANFSR